MPGDFCPAAPLTVQNGLSPDQPEQSTGFNMSGGVVDLGLDQAFADGQVFVEHSIRIHPSHQHAAAQLFRAEACSGFREDDQVPHGSFQTSRCAEGHCCSGDQHIAPMVFRHPERP